jgi:hypothetical protein
LGLIEIEGERDVEGNQACTSRLGGEDQGLGVDAWEGGHVSALP